MKSMDYFRLAVLAVLFFIVLSFFQGGLSPFWSNVRLATAFASWGLLMATLWHRQKDEKKEQQKRREEFLETWARPNFSAVKLGFEVWVKDEQGKDVQVKPWVSK